jgi:tetrahydromethanopterin S-methyltransferase subunit B
MGVETDRERLTRVETKIDNICDALLPQIRTDVKEVKEQVNRLEQKFDDNHTELACVHTEIDSIEESAGLNRKLILGFVIPLAVGLVGIIVKLVIGG